MRELNQLLLNLIIKLILMNMIFIYQKVIQMHLILINRWPDWDKKILNISGEKFSGKSHLANIFKLKSKAFY